MFKPLNGRVLIQPDEKETTTTYGFMLPEDEKEKPTTGTVIVGGQDVQEGDRVVFSRYGYDEVEIENKLFYVVSEATLLGIFNV